MKNQKVEGPGPKPRLIGRGVARLGAVQALFQMDFAGSPLDSVLEEFLDFRLGELARAAKVSDIDRDFFVDLVRGVTQRREELDTFLGPALSEGWTLGRLDNVLRAIVRTGTYELLARPDVPPRVAINEYVNLTHAFFDKKEAGFVNALLDSLAQRLRPTDLEPPKGEEAADHR